MRTRGCKRQERHRRPRCHRCRRRRRSGPRQRPACWAARSQVVTKACKAPHSHSPRCRGAGLSVSETDHAPWGRGGPHLESPPAGRPARWRSHRRTKRRQRRRCRLLAARLVPPDTEGTGTPCTPSLSVRALQSPSTARGKPAPFAQEVRAHALPRPVSVLRSVAMPCSPRHLPAPHGRATAADTRRHVVPVQRTHIGRSRFDPRTPHAAHCSVNGRAQSRKSSSSRRDMSTTSVRPRYRLANPRHNCSPADASSVRTTPIRVNRGLAKKTSKDRTRSAPPRQHGCSRPPTLRCRSPPYGRARPARQSG